MWSRTFLVCRVEGPPNFLPDALAGLEGKQVSEAPRAGRPKEPSESPRPAYKRGRKNYE